MQIAVETGIELPAVQRVGRLPTYPWLQMEIGASFLFPKKLKAAAAHSSAFGASKRYDRKFLVRKTEDGFRCWRTA
jgi:hypothetical protein